MIKTKWNLWSSTGKETLIKGKSSKNKEFIHNERGFYCGGRSLDRILLLVIVIYNPQSVSHFIKKGKRFIAGSLDFTISIIISNRAMN